jgi:hypothetical protein
VSDSTEDWVAEEMRKRLRDQFAMAALPAIVPNECREELISEATAASISRDAYKIADAMLRAREGK